MGIKEQVSSTFGCESVALPTRSYYQNGQSDTDATLLEFEIESYSDKKSTSDSLTQ